MEKFDIELAAKMLEELADRVEAGEVIGLTRDGELVARLIPAHLPMT